MQTVHATAVALGDAAVLIRGAPGSGKSDLALRLIDGGGILVADDRTALRILGNRVIASAPAAIAGRMEVRGLGIVRVPFQADAPVGLVIDLIAPDAMETVERLPEPRFADLCGIRLPCLRMRAFESSAPAKIRLAMRLGPADME
ncbi:MAG: HPr kinase/phosphorylase [Alphaproteobacteria bacterium]